MIGYVLLTASHQKTYPPEDTTMSLLHYNVVKPHTIETPPLPHTISASLVGEQIIKHQTLRKPPNERHKAEQAGCEL